MPTFSVGCSGLHTPQVPADSAGSAQRQHGLVVVDSLRRSRRAASSAAPAPRALWVQAHALRPGLAEQAALSQDEDEEAGQGNLSESAVEQDAENQEDEEDGSDEEAFLQMLTSTRPTPRLSPEEVWETLFSNVHENASSTYKAFYSSELGGIVTEPALMSVAIDDHMVHRGHAVFDTALLVDGYLYQLDQHLLRFLTSASKAALDLPMSAEQMYRTILETTAASQIMNGSVRYWLSAGRGGFGLSSTECICPSFYVMVCSGVSQAHDVAKGLSVKTSPVPIKDSYFATLKSTNYLANVLNVLDAEAEGFDQGVFVDPEGNIAEGPNMNIGIITHEKELVAPPFEHALAGITMQRVLELAPQLVDEGELTGIAQRPIALAEAQAAAEVFLTSSSLQVMPVVAWDGQAVGEGKAGIATLMLRSLLDQDMNPESGAGMHVEVPYHTLSGAIDY